MNKTRRVNLCAFETTSAFVEGILATLTAGWRFRTLEITMVEKDYIYTYIHVYTYIYTYIHIYIYTYIYIGRSHSR